MQRQCDSIVHFKTKKCAQGDVECLRDLMVDISDAVAAAQGAINESMFPNTIKYSFNLVVSDRRKWFARKNMFITRMRDFQQVFPRNRDALDRLAGPAMNTFLERINQLYFCAIAGENPRVAELIAKTNARTNELMRAVLSQRPLVPIPKS